MDYLERLYSGSDGEGFLSVWCKQTKEAQWFAAGDLLNAKIKMCDVGKLADIYHGWCLMKAQPAVGRGKSQDAWFSPGIMFDADLFSSEPNIHSQSCLPNNLGEVMDWLVEANFPVPTQIRSSGNGLYLDWLHEGGKILQNEEQWREYSAAVKVFHLALRTSALDRRGWKFDATHDLARVTRMPGTFNHKTNPPKLVEVLS